MPAQVFRIKKRDRSLFSGGLGKHNRGDQRPWYAFPRPGEAAVVTLIDNRAEGEALLAAIDAQPKRRGKQPAVAVELFYQGPAPYGDRDEWPPEKVQAWVKAVEEWTQRCTKGAATIVEAYLHQDEGELHAHVGVIPATWDDLRPSKLKLEHALAGRVINDHRERMSAIQDRLYADVSSKYGLERGEKRTGKRNAPPDHGAGIRKRAETAERRARDAEDEAEKTREQAKQETERAQAAAAEQVRQVNDRAVADQMKRAIEREEEAEARKQDERERAEMHDQVVHHQEEAEYYKGRAMDAEMRIVTLEEAIAAFGGEGGGSNLPDSRRPVLSLDGEPEAERAAGTQPLSDTELPERVPGQVEPEPEPDPEEMRPERPQAPGEDGVPRRRRN